MVLPSMSLYIIMYMSDILTIFLAARTYLKGKIG